MKRFSIGTVVFLLSLFMASQAFSQPVEYGVRPIDPMKGFFEYELGAGELMEDAVEAFNHSEETVRLKIEVLDAHTALTGGVSFPGESVGVAQWIDLPEAGIIEVPPGMALQMPFTVNVPEDTPIGEYVAGFVVAPFEEQDVEGEEAVSVEVVTRVAVGVVIRVPGEMHCEVSVDALNESLHNGRWKVELAMRSTGNKHFKGNGALTLRPASGGDPVLQRSFPVGYFLAGDAIDYPLYFEQPPEVGDYAAEVMLQGDDCDFNGTFNDEISVSPDLVEQAKQQLRERQEAEARANEEAAKALAQAELIRSISMGLIALAVMILVALLVLFLLSKRRKKEEEDVAE
jgi:hypothetical protein